MLSWVIAACDNGRPSTVADAEKVMVVSPTGCDAGALIVMIEACPAVMLRGLKLAVTPEGRPLTFSVASWLNPLLLASVTAKLVLCPWISSPVAGAADKLKLEEAVIVSGDADVVPLAAIETVIGPVPAPAGTTKAKLVAVVLDTGPAMLPPPCLARVT